MKPNMGNILKQAQKMQEQMLKAQEQLDQVKAEGTSGGGMVKVVANGKQEIESIKIDPEVVNSDDVEMLEDLVAAAVNQAIEKANEASKDKMNEATGGMLGGMPPGMNMPGF
ncbi:MAG: YbaB/EbfC family nucleoid-associated protein [bacterium]|nr:YbaB/EbfC family nucleoid-associated protein [bacterium]